MNSETRKGNPAGTAADVWVQLLMLSLIFGIGCALGWVIWGRAGTLEDSWRGSDGSVPPRKRVLGANRAGGEPAVGGSRDAGSESLKKCLRALAIVDPDARGGEFIAALREMQPEDALPIFARIKEDIQPDKAPNREWEAFLRGWGEADPKGAFEFALRQETPKAQGFFLKMMIEGWARRDYAAAAHWLNEHPNAPEWDGICAGLLRGIASRDPWMASETAIASIPDGSDWLRDYAAGYIAAAMGRRGGMEELKRWFESIPAGTAMERKFKEKGMALTAQQLEQSDPAEARKWLEAQPPELWRSRSAYTSAAKKLAKTDRAGALNWLASLPAGKATVGREAGREIFRAWQEEKPEEAMQWSRTVTDHRFLTDISALQKAPGERPAK
jgi:hypothetical protein